MLGERLRIADLFCGAGGAAKGLHDAGFEVVGFDINPQKNYPFEFHQADALTVDLRKFNAVWASPPCQHYTQALTNSGGFNQNGIRKTKEDYPDLLGDVKSLFQAIEVPWIIENVVGAPFDWGVVLCGQSFGLPIYRHRVFQSSHLVFAPGHIKHTKRIQDGTIVPVYNGKWMTNGSAFPVPREVRTRQAWRTAMGIDWMTKQELTQAIPPAYSAFLGKQLIECVRSP